MTPGGDQRQVAIAASGALCGLATVTLIAGAAETVRLTGAEEQARHLLQFGFDGVPRSPWQMASIALHNAKFVVGAIVGAAVVPHTSRRVRLAFDVLLSSVLVINGSAIGIAIGAYGTRVLPILAPHLPLEIAATSAAGGVYVRSRTAPVAGTALTVVALGSVALLILAAALETYVQGGVR